MNKLLIISFDAVGDGAFDRLSRLPNMAAFLREAALTREVRSVFLTNTYPVHVSVVTGLPPAKHGLVSNVPPFPELHPRWNYRAQDIKARTLWQEVDAGGGTAASLFWPVTGGAKEIRWNVPEIMPCPGENLLSLYLANGTASTVLWMLARYGRLLKKTLQPALDRFTTACACDLLRRKRPNLVLVHLTAYDSLCHQGGPDSPEAEAGLASLDESLAALLDAAGADYRVIAFSDHSQLAVTKELCPNDLLVEEGLLTKDAAGNYADRGESCFIECCGGSAFFHAGRLDTRRRAGIKAKIIGSEGFNRFLTPEERAESGMTGAAAGWCYRPGFCCEAAASGHKGQHGYPADYEGYRVFYAVRSPSGSPGSVSGGGSLLDIAPLARSLLGL